MCSTSEKDLAAGAHVILGRLGLLRYGSGPGWPEKDLESASRRRGIHRCTEHHSDTDVADCQDFVAERAAGSGSKLPDGGDFRDEGSTDNADARGRAPERMHQDGAGAINE